MTRRLRRWASRTKAVKSAMAIGRMDVLVVGDVVAVVAQRRGIERQQPQRRDPEILQVVELLPQAAEVADAVVIGIEEGLDVQLVDDRVLVPERVGTRRARRRAGQWLRQGEIVGRGHQRDRTRNSNAGLTAGSRRTRWLGPRQSARAPVKASSTANSAACGRPSSASGSSRSPSWAACGSRVTATMTTLPRSAVAFA